MPAVSVLPLGSSKNLRNLNYITLTIYAYGLTASAFLTSRMREYATIGLVELSNEHEGVERRDAVCNHRTYELCAGGLFALHEERLP